MQNFQPFALFVVAALHLFFGLQSALPQRPNVIVIMSDDQGGGDYGFMGNDVIRTPNLDRMADRGAVMTRFYVSNVCAPTRASLMTGRYNYRTRCIDTYIGRAMMDTDEVTIAEYLRDAGYNTGIYGKWHLGDNYPMRPMDQGFQDSLVHRGGGIGQASDPIGAEGKYTNPTLIRNGVEAPMEGYCTDIYFDKAMDFIAASVASEKNFFAYIATNAPHGPFHDVPKDLYERYKRVDFRPIMIDKELPVDRYKKQADNLARISAMITNIDNNVGRLFAKLDSLGVADNTIVVYLNDNGPNSMRFVGSMRGMKTHVDDGGIRSPLVWHWPSEIKAGTRSDVFAAHIDVLPTILEACSLKASKKIVDGRSFLPVLKQRKVDLPERTVVFQSHRGNQPFRFHHFALHKGPWKLVHPSGFGKERFEGSPKLELYHLQNDPYQKDNLVGSNPDKLEELKREYISWFEDVSSTRPENYSPPRIIVGTDNEPVTVLTRQDWRLPSRATGRSQSVGSWLLEAPEACQFRAEIIFRGDPPAGRAKVRIGSTEHELELLPKQARGHFVDVAFPSGNVDFTVECLLDGKTKGPHQVILSRK